MTYVPVSVYNLDGDFLGYSIKDDGANNLHSANLWTESPEDVADLQSQLTRLNDSSAILAFWPDVRDSEVQALLDNPDFEPLVLSPVEVVDEDASTFVWIEEPSDENPFGQMDREASDIVQKIVQAPSAVDVQRRVKTACERVARQRANV